MGATSSKRGPEGVVDEVVEVMRAARRFARSTDFRMCAWNPETP